MAAPASKSANLFAGGVILFAALAAYHNSFSGPFVLDDSSSIVGNPTIHYLWPPSVPLSPPHGAGQTVEGRPVLNLSLAVNYAIGGVAVWSYHALNLAIHILAGLTLYGIVRRTLRRSASVADEAAWLALASALLWTVHPLQTESVTYIVQRAESLMGLFYLLTLYCFIRAAEFPSSFPSAPEDKKAGRRTWAVLSVSACFFGMATKEVMVSAPLIVLLYDRTFVAGSFRAAWRQRRGLHLALAATWIPLAALVFRAGGRGGTSGPGSGVDVWTYWLTQFPTVLRYLRLAVWPYPLVFDYGTEWVASFQSVLPAAALVLGLIAASACALLRFPAKPLAGGGRALGFAGAWFFAILAPTSLVPGNRQTAAEHRMYLALVPLIVLLVMGIRASISRGWPRGASARGQTQAFGAVVFGLAFGLGLLTADRNRDYRSRLVLYADTVAKDAGNAFAQSNLGVALFARGRVPEAIAHDEQAIRLRPDYATAYDNLGSALLRLGRAPEAARQFEEALRLKPDFADAYHNLGTAYATLGHPAEAVGPFEAALRLDPDSAATHHNFGNVLFRLGRSTEAIAQYREALRLAPDDAEAAGDLGNTLAAEGRGAEAIACFEQAVRLDPADSRTHYNFGNTLLGMARLNDAVAQFRAALQLRPDYPSAHDNLGNAFLRLGRVAEAAAQYEETIRLQPDHAVAHYNLGNALLRLGRVPEAAVQFREAVRLQPDFAEARQMLARLVTGP